MEDYVAKFGGTSLADAEPIRKVCRIIVSDPERRLVVVSAPGRRSKGDTKVTDLLIACAEGTASGTAPRRREVAAVLGRYAEIAEELGTPRRRRRRRHPRHSRSASGAACDDPRRFTDASRPPARTTARKLVATTSRIARRRTPHYVSPREAGLLLSDEYRQRARAARSLREPGAPRGAAGVTVFPGFFGYTPEGALVTFPRGGSDITGSILAAAVKAEVYENFTDVDSRLRRRPVRSSRTRAIAELTYREMRELSYAGFSVFHDEALEPAPRGRPVCIKNTNNPAAPGTAIVPEREITPGARRRHRQRRRLLHHLRREVPDEPRSGLRPPAAADPRGGGLLLRAHALGHRQHLGHRARAGARRGVEARILDRIRTSWRSTTSTSSAAWR